MILLSICTRELMLNHLLKSRILGQDVATTTGLVNKVQECHTDQSTDQENDIKPIENDQSIKVKDTQKSFKPKGRSLLQKTRKHTIDDKSQIPVRPASLK